ncbi:MAG: ABC transporter substrate-binding protein, partial [Desulfatiglandales bacterium]
MRRVFILIFLSSLFWPPLLKAEEAIFRVGMTISMSGPFSQEVGPFKDLVKTWQKRINQRGGMYIGSLRHKLEIVIYDDRSDQTAVRAAYERLIRSDKADLLLGPYSSPLTFASSIPAEEMNKPFLAICGNSPKIYERGYKTLLGILDLAPNYTSNY